jgi:hypothetical protein
MKTDEMRLGLGVQKANFSSKDVSIEGVITRQEKDEDGNLLPIFYVTWSDGTETLAIPQKLNARS